MQCQGNGCKREAGYAPVILIPAKGWPEDLHAPARFIVPTAMCNRCVAACRLADYMNDSVRKQVDSMVHENYAQGVDYSRARMDKHKMSPKQLLQLTGGQHAAGTASAT